MPHYAVASAEGPNGLFATLEPTRLIIRCAETKLLLRNIDLDPKLVSAVRHLKWYRSPPSAVTSTSTNQSTSPPTSPLASPTQSSPYSNCERLLLATSDTVHVYEVSNQRWTAVVRKICGDGQRIAHLDFGSHPDELVAWSALGIKASLVSLATGAAAELRDPKAPAARCCSLRPGSGHLAVLTRPGTKDVLTVLAPGGDGGSEDGLGERVGRVEYGLQLPTVDAQGVRWSPDGNWIAVWDAATAGSSLLVYTAAGQLFKRLSGGGSTGTGSGPGAEDLGYGIQRVDWDPSGRYLAVAANEGKIVLLSPQRSFQPVIALDYPSTISSAHATVHEEQISPDDGTRAYRPAQQPATLPPPASPANDGGSSLSTSTTASALGFNQLTMANSGDLLACVPASSPTTVWIHSIHPNPQLTAVLIHHGAVRHLAWHPHQHGLLLIHCAGTGSAEEASSNTSPAAEQARPQSRPQSRVQHARSQSQAQSQGQRQQQQQKKASKYWTGSADSASSQAKTPTAQSSSAVYLWGYDLPEPLVLPQPAASDSGGGTISKAVWLQSAIKTQAMITTATTCTLISVLELESNNSGNPTANNPNYDPNADADNDDEYPTPKPPPTVLPPPANVATATPAAVLGYYPDNDSELMTPLTARTGGGGGGGGGGMAGGYSSFSPVKMDTAQLTRTLGFQFTSLADEKGEEEDTFEYKQALGQKPVRPGLGLRQAPRKVSAGGVARRGAGGAR